jgi:hypothetical protein
MPVGPHRKQGDTPLLPTQKRENTDAVHRAWQVAWRHTRHSLERGYYQGWDLHPAQLVPRFVANTLFYREGLASATMRLHNYVQRVESAVMDEPATARALAAFVLRGISCGAVTEAEVQDAAGLDVAALTALAHPRLATAPATTQESS